MAKKDLYLAKSFEELALKWKDIPNVKNVKYESLLISLKKLQKSANEHYLRGDEEYACILYMKYFTLLTLISKRDEFNSSIQKQIQTELGGHSVCMSLIERLEKIKNSLSSRYEQKYCQKRFKDPEIEISQTSSTKTPETENIDISSFSIISNAELFKRLKEKSTGTLLIDVRFKEDFEASNIVYSYCLNVPGNMYKKGFSAGKIQEMLSPKEKMLWSSRSVKDQVVIIGYNSRDEAPRILKDIMENWDPDTNYKSPIRILKDGFESFLLVYPTECTNPHYTSPKVANEGSENLEEIEYPEIGDIMMKDEIKLGSVPEVNRADKSKAMKIYEQRNLNEIIEEKNKLSTENDKTNQEFEEVSKSLRETEQSHDSEEYKKLTFRIWELETEKKNQNYKEQLLIKEIQDLKKMHISKVDDNEKSIIENHKISEPIPKQQVIINEPQIEKLIPVKQVKPEFDRSVKPQINNSQFYKDELEDKVLTGLKNLGNTCYMNSILQCLFSSLMLRKFLISNNYKNSINYKSKTKGYICEETAGLFKRMNSGEYKYVECAQLKSYFGEHQKMFRGRDQQDAHEFLTIFIDCLHLELNTIRISRPFSENNSSEKCWNEFTKGEESKILQIFYGQIKSTVKCVTCEKESATHETFSNLSLELPAQAQICLLTDCLDLYFAGERISGWICPKCKQKRDAIKKLSISRLPEILVIHLKRFFVNTDYGSNVYKKKENYVKFPIDNLDVNSYLAKSLMKHTQKNYDLFSVCNHFGTMESGHYTAFCRRSLKQWFKCDDSSVTPFEEKNVDSCAAYILFYKRKY